jgi:N-acetylmuramoyl-L-alanine amidase
MRIKSLSATVVNRMVACLVAGVILLSAIASYAIPEQFGLPSGPNKLFMTPPSQKARALSVCRSAFRLALDVGHTPELPGTLTARGRTEYEFNLNLATFIQAQLAARGYNNVHLIKMSGGLETLEKRVEIANEFRAHLFLSIHHDSAQPKYFETWVVDGKTQEYSDRFSGFSLFVSEKNPNWRRALNFAELLSDKLLKRDMHFTLHHAEAIKGENRQLLDRKRGIYRFDQLKVLKGFHGPAVLLEAAVVINRDEELVAASEQRHQIIADAVGDALDSYCMTFGARLSS